MKPLIQAIEKEQIKSDLPDFRSGDTVQVDTWVVEGKRKRLQAFTGVVIAMKRTNSMHFSFIVRKTNHGTGTEQTFQAHSPRVEKITVIKRGRVRKANIYYLRDLTGRAARITADFRKHRLIQSEKSKAKKTTAAQAEATAANAAQAETKPAEAKPAETKPAEAKPASETVAKAEAKPAETKPASEITAKAEAKPAADKKED